MARNSPTPGETITDDTGNHQLITRWARLGDGFNFDALVWRSRENDAWEERVVITREAFEAGTDRRRWVSSLHSFDPTCGTAIIKVAEGDLPRGADRVHYTYSWREWDLAHNREFRFIRTCESPHESFDTQEV
jgi:hypothetical protein